MRILRAAGGMAVWVLIGIALLLEGCAITRTRSADGSTTVGVFPGLAPGDEVQTIDVTIVGISIDATRDSLDIGYKKLRMTRVPSFDGPAIIPNVSATTSTTTGIGMATTITDNLSIGKKP